MNMGKRGFVHNSRFRLVSLVPPFICLFAVGIRRKPEHK